MEYVGLNLTTILIATLLGLIVGLFHFFLSRPGERPAFDFAALTAIAEFWLATLLAGALIVGPRETGDPFMDAAVTVVVIWIGFIVPVLLVTQRFRGLPGPMAAADSLHWLVVLLVQAMAMTSIGLERPPMPVL